MMVQKRTRVIALFFL